jgi:UDP-N-acetylmuramyl tripeptide synthase
MTTNIIQEVYNIKRESVREKLQKANKEVERLAAEHVKYTEKMQMFDQEKKLLKIYSGNNVILCNADTFGIIQGKKFFINGDIIIYNKNCQSERLCQNRTIIDIVGIDDIIPMSEYEMKEELFQVFMEPKEEEFEFNI